MDRTILCPLTRLHVPFEEWSNWDLGHREPVCVRNLIYTWTGSPHQRPLPRHITLVLNPFIYKQFPNCPTDVAISPHQPWALEVVRRQSPVLGDRWATDTQTGQTCAAVLSSSQLHVFVFLFVSLFYCWLHRPLLTAPHVFVCLHFNQYFNFQQFICMWQSFWQSFSSEF